MLGKQQVKILQPILKGDNTAELLEKMVDKLTKLNGIILENRIAIAKIGNAFISHMHFGGSPLAGPVVSPPSPQALALAPEPTIKAITKISENVLQAANDGISKENYFNEHGPKYIKSKAVSST